MKKTIYLIFLHISGDLHHQNGNLDGGYAKMPPYQSYLALCADKNSVHTEETVIASQGEVQEIPSLRDFLHHGTEGSPPVGRHGTQLHTVDHRGTG